MRICISFHFFHLHGTSQLILIQKSTLAIDVLESGAEPTKKTTSPERYSGSGNPKSFMSRKDKI
jgi:hypothetical protein